MGRRWPWSETGTLPAQLVPKDMLADGSYRRSGYRCWTCPWKTDKVGLSGRQAARGHSRVHAYDRRSWQRPLAAIVVLAAMAAVLAALGHFGLWRLAPLVSIGVPRVISLAAFSAPLAIAFVVFVGAILKGWETVSHTLLWWLRVVTFCCLLPAFATTAIMLGVVEGNIGTVELFLAAISCVAAMYFGCFAGSVRLRLRRRTREPSAYTELATASSWDSEYELRRRVTDAAHDKTTGKPGAARKRPLGAQPAQGTTRRSSRASGRAGGDPRRPVDRKLHSTD